MFPTPISEVCGCFAKTPLEIGSSASASIRKTSEIGVGNVINNNSVISIMLVGVKYYTY